MVVALFFRESRRYVRAAGSHHSCRNSHVGRISTRRYQHGLASARAGTSAEPFCYPAKPGFVSG